jgi:hypothetical protein
LHFAKLKHSLLPFAVDSHFILQEKEATTKQVGETSMGIHEFVLSVKHDDIDWFPT